MCYFKGRNFIITIIIVAAAAVAQEKAEAEEQVDNNIVCAPTVIPLLIHCGMSVCLFVCADICIIICKKRWKQ